MTLSPLFVTTLKLIVSPILYSSALAVMVIDVTNGSVVSSLLLTPTPPIGSLSHAKNDNKKNENNFKK